MDAHFTTKKAYDGHIGLLAAKMYSWSNLRDACRDTSTRLVIKHREQNAFKKTHKAQINDGVYNQRSMSEMVFAMLKDEGDEIRPRNWHGEFRELTLRLYAALQL